MEPISTVVISNLVIQLAKKGLDKAFEKGGEKVSEGAYNWIKSLFFKEDKPKKILEELKESPNDIEKLSNAVAIINNSIEDNPEFEDYLKEIIEKVSKIEVNINNSKNIIIGNVNTNGGDFRLGDEYGK